METLTALTRDELLALSLNTDNALAWAETVGNDTMARELRASRRLISAELTRRDTCPECGRQLTLAGEGATVGVPCDVEVVGGEVGGGRLRA